MPRFLTGVKPTSGQLHIANYFGAIKQMIDYSSEHPDTEMFLFLANMHSLTQVHNSEDIKQFSMNALKLYIACLEDQIDNFYIYNSSEIPAHAQLNWVLSCVTNMWFMERMHAYKDAINKGNEKNISVGTFNYPILMAADILLYDADAVPVGKDQKQHVEYARDIAQKFNKTFGETFILPKPYINPNVATVPGIDGQKMSKSYNNYIWLLDDDKTILKRVKQIATDTKTVEEPKDPDACNVYNITKLFLTAEEDNILRKKYTAGGLSYKYAKDYLYEKLTSFIGPIRNRVENITDEEVKNILQKGKEKAAQIAEKKIADILKKTGLSL